jgi:transposase
MIEEKILWFGGIDWGSEKHQACILDAQGDLTGERDFQHSGAGLAELCDWIVSIAGDVSTVAVAIEVPHGPVVDVLLDRGFAVYSINPKQLDRLRDRFGVAGAKDDRRDARVCADGLRNDRHLFRRLQIADPCIVGLRDWSRLAEELQQERVRLGNRVSHQLWRYYPQMLELTNDVAADWFLQLWAMVPTPAKAKRIRGSTIAQLLKRHRIRRLDVEIVLCALRQPAIKVAAGVAEAACVHLRSLAARLRLVNRDLRNAECKLDELCAALGEQQSSPGHSDVAILKSLPGIGRINLATLLAEASGPLSRRDYSALRTLSGVAPVTKTAASLTPLSCAVPRTTDCATRSITGRGSPFSMTKRAAAVTWPCASAVIPMAAPFAVSPTDYSNSLAPSCSDKPCSIPTTVRPATA